MAARELVSKTGRQLAAMIKNKEISPVELTKADLERIHALNCQVNAFITMTDEPALQQARAAEKQIAAGKYFGPLRGLPYAPRDILATKGIVTTNRSKVTADWVPRYESTIPTRLNRVPGRQHVHRQHDGAARARGAVRLQRGSAEAADHDHVLWAPIP